MEREDQYKLLAQACHEVNRAYCAAIGDNTQKPWEDAADWQRTSAVNGVRGVIENGNDYGDSHKSWLKEKEETGWVYGEVKDEQKKTHHYMVPFEKLPSEQQYKDHLFVDTARGLAAALNIPLQRRA